MAIILLLYIMYCCCVRYFTRKRNIREKRRGQLMSEMETRMGRTAEGNRSRSNLAIEMVSPPSAPCGRGHLHVPEYHNNQNQNSNQTESRGTQQDATFSNWVFDHYSPVNRIILQWEISNHRTTFQIAFHDCFLSLQLSPINYLN